MFAPYFLIDNQLIISFSCIIIITVLVSEAYPASNYALSLQQELAHF